MVKIIYTTDYLTFDPNRYIWMTQDNKTDTTNKNTTYHGHKGT
jgi:hypothetical protein